MFTNRIDKIGGAVLVDAPGVQDDNSARDKLVREYLAAADSILIVANIRRQAEGTLSEQHGTLRGLVNPAPASSAFCQRKKGVSY